MKGKITTPDVLIQAHSASLGLVFYNGKVPPEYYGDGFAAEDGSWNRSRRTGYKVIRIRLKDGFPMGEYQDFPPDLMPTTLKFGEGRLELRSPMTALSSCRKTLTERSGGSPTSA